MKGFASPFWAWYLAVLGIILVAGGSRHIREKELIENVATSEWREKNSAAKDSELSRSLEVVCRLSLGDYLDFLWESLLPVLFWAAGFFLLQTGYVVAGKAFRSAAWVTLAAVAFFSIVEILTSVWQILAYRGKSEVEILSVNEESSYSSESVDELQSIHTGFLAPIFRVMDRFYLGPTERFEVPLQEGEQVELVCRASPWYSVYPVVVLQTILAVIISLFLSGLVSLMLMVFPIFTDFGTFISEGLNFPTWVLVLDLLLTVPLAAFLSYVFAEWNRRRFVFVFFTLSVWVVRIKAPFGTPLLSFGPAKLIEEAHAKPAGGERGEGVVRVLDSFYDGILHRIFGIADIFLHTRVIGALDVMPGIGEAFNVEKVVRKIGRNAGRLDGVISWAWLEFYKARVQEQEGTVMPEIQPESLIDALSAAVPKEADRINLMFVRDPGVWDIRWQERKSRTAGASGISSAAVEFPDAD